jgi:DNA-binding CsgD family transcriptional regulator/tetratricopeptide (TPR) repeat protein
MHLLEREPILAELDALLLSAAGGAGRIAAIAGEAGAGKTSLVEHFATGHRATARTLHGLCDPLSTPRPLGPVHDMLPESRGPLAAARRDGGGRDKVFAAFLAELRLEPAPVVVVVEDVHWADDATLDLLRFVGRRLGELPALLLVTFRDDEIGPEHQLRHLLGQLPQRVVHRIPLPPLSRAAVEQMAASSGRSAAEVYALTGGNCFFVSELLASRGTEIPVSIREAVLARAARLPATARELLDLVSLMPGRASRGMLDALFQDAGARIRECAASGVIVAAAADVAFRHELARLAWQESLDAGERAELHGRILEALLDSDDGARDLSRIVHHADGAGDADRVLHFAPAAARAAAEARAHRQAAAHYATALRYASGLPAATRAAMLESHGYECYLIGQLDVATRAYDDALALRRALDDRRGEGSDLRWLSRLAWFRGQHADAVRQGVGALAVLEPIGSTPELAMAYSNLAQLSMLAEDATGAKAWGERAIAIAEDVGDAETLVHALTNVGSAEMYTEKEAGVRRLERAIVLGEQHGFHEHVARAWNNLACNYVRLHDYPNAREAIERTLRFATDHEMERYERYIRGWRARLNVECGNWPAADVDVTFELAREAPIDVVRFQPLIARTLLMARRGEPGAEALAGDLFAFALPTAEPQRIGPAVAARAELAWLRGEPRAAMADLAAVSGVLRGSDDRWSRGLLAWWEWRASGATTLSPDALPEPHARAIVGDWRGAAEAWGRVGAPYERALSLAAGDAPQAWHEAIAVLEELGAPASVGAVRRDLQRRGARGIPRGPREATRSNPAGLTPGQVRVLELLTRGLSNADIARALNLSSRTVDHHVSAILAKLDVSTRAAAIAAAHERRLLAPR